MSNFVPVSVIDRVNQTDPHVFGGMMHPGDPQGIGLHHTGSANEAGDEYYLSHYHANPVSVQQLVHRDGTIIQIVPNDNVAWSFGVSEWFGRPACNLWMIGIEICNRGNGVEKYTDAQYEAVAQTVAYNAARFHINDKNITSHARVALPLGRKDDPKGWDWLRMWARIDQLLAHWPYDIIKWHGVGHRILSTS